MKLAIVGIGEMFNLETGQMQDTLQVSTPNGVISVPTTNEAAQALIASVMGNGQPAAPSADNYLSQQMEQAHEMVQPGVVVRVERQTTAQMDLPQPIDDIPEGATVFGGDASVGRLEGEPRGLSDADPVVEAKARAAVKQAQAVLGARQNPADRSGVPSRGISGVDEKGNPKLPPPPDETIEDEDDPGEQI